MMALKSLFLLLAPLATALVPPCLPELGPQFCPDTAVATNVDILTERTPIAYPDLNHEDLLKNDIFPLLVCSPLHYTDSSSIMLIKPPTSSQNTTDLEEGLRMFTQPKWQPNRYCMSRFGIVAKNLIGEVVYRLIDAELRLPNDSSFLNSIKYIDNKTPQKSIVFRVMPPAAPFKPGNTIVLGAHMDSINGRPRHNNESADKMIAPGADDNASGTIVLLTVLKALCRLFAEKPVINEVQFHFYGAEEIGLLGSKTVFAAMQNQSFDVKAMLNLDMVGYAGGHESGSPKIALQQGYANKDLTNFVAKLIETVSALCLGEQEVVTSCLHSSSTLMLSLTTPSAAIHAPTMLRRI